MTNNSKEDIERELKNLQTIDTIKIKADYQGKIIDSHTIEEVLNYKADLEIYLTYLINNESFEKRAFSTRQTIILQLRQLFDELRQLEKSFNENYFRNCFNKFDQLISYLFSQNLANDSGIALDYESELLNIKNLKNITENLIKENQALKENLKSLITPSLSSALSNSFDQRAKKFKRVLIIWAAIAILSASGAGLISYKYLHEIFSIIQATTSNQQLVAIVLIRIAYVFPCYYLLVFATKQYLKEREILEKYEHKSAITKSLPSFQQLDTDTNRKHEFTNKAIDVVFKEPLSETNESKSSLKITQKELDQFIKFVQAIKSEK